MESINLKKVLLVAISSISIIGTTGCSKVKTPDEVEKILNDRQYTIGYEWRINEVFALPPKSDDNLIEFTYHHNSDQLLVTNILYEGMDLNDNKIYDANYADLKEKTNSKQSTEDLKKQAKDSLKILNLSEQEVKSYLKSKYKKEYKKFEKRCKEIEATLVDNGYKIQVSENKDGLLINNKDNTLNAWFFEKYDTLSYMNSDIHSIVIDPLTGEYSKSTFFDNGESYEALYNSLNPNFTKEKKEELKSDSDNRLEKMNISLIDLDKYCWDKLYNHPDKSIVLRNNESNNSNSTNGSKSNTQQEKFVAKGIRALMPFINSKDRSGYIIDDPSRDGNWVTCKIKPVNANDYYNNIKIRYYVEDQKVYCVDVIADNSDIMNTEEFKNACIGMTLALNPDISQEDAASGVIAGLNSDSAILQNNTQFLKDFSKYTLTISY